MSPVLIAVLALAAPPVETDTLIPRPLAVALAQRVERAPRTGSELRSAVRAALSRWARPSDTQADAAAREFLGLYQELRADSALARSQRRYFLTKVRIRLTQLSAQISKRVAREKRLAKTREPKTEPPKPQTPNTIKPAQGEAHVLAQQQGGPWMGGGFRLPPGAGRPALGRGPFQVPDHGQQLVELIQTVIQPDSWDINGGHGSIFYWYPGRALIVRQTGEVHGQIEGALGLMRRAGN